MTHPKWWKLRVRYDPDEQKWYCAVLDEPGAPKLYGDTPALVRDALKQIGIIPERCRMQRRHGRKYFIFRIRKKRNAVKKNTQSRQPATR